ncbi:MAG: cyclic lactone autoinducer peptide [Butyrivibrio sp.]|jgi:cyclic lactone autoinducer peptide|uniref:cyclic lactone autoinducer peptide n=1 Tax=Butyrivibrio sp. TaxID=28121 RepID=UPI001EBF39C9|nr:cyclic lactone autoinducer peptide [Butyrivibrio sp.]MBE5840615.1 cyclic lactone autoinducer peptide [Butyrivibrio sp.]
MKTGEWVKKATLRVGIMIARIDAKTSCPWINYQPCEPKGIVRLRQMKEKE